MIATEKLNQDGLEEEQLGNEEDGLNDNQPGNSGNTQNPSVTPDNNKGGQDSADSDSKDGEKISVTIQILCDTVASDMSKLSNQDVAACIPDNGVILKKRTVKVKKNATVYDVLLQACRSNNIQTSAIYTPMYGSYYVEAINGLYEFDAGESSGWMFKVNNIFPTYGPSEVKVVEGDSIVWCYTCNLGPDVGNSQQKR